ncbi:MAG TPA: pyruvate kinase [Parachlamydiales bacterium]|nr:pyruvate kinase [Parachlamydiales bacterium]
METRTKIVCTIGPSVRSYEKILELIDAGMNCARLNFSHGTHDEHREVIFSLKKAREERKIPLCIMLDTKGPEIRVGLLKEGQVPLKEKQRILLVGQEREGDAQRISIMPSSALESLEVGMRVLFDDGYIISVVVEVTKEGVVVEVQNSGVLKNRKGVNLPDTKVNLPAMTEQDRLDLAFGVEMDVDLIAASFIRSAEHVLEIKRYLIEQGKSDILVMAKIESREGVDHFDSIVQAADGIMVARGDLGVELPLEEVPHLQKMMIRKCYLVNKPVITATQMLESMINNPRPTRAEASDVANAIYDSTSAVMLSGETAAGKYPIEAVKIMRRIVKEAERDFSYRDFFHVQSRQPFRDISISVAVATVSTAYNAGAKAIFVLTNSGLSSRILARFRPSMPILALSPKLKTYHQLALNWGVIPVPSTFAKNEREALEIIGAYAKKIQEVQEGDLIVLSAGTPFGVSGSTNLMLVENIGDVAVRGQPGFGSLIHGQIKIVHSPEEEKEENLIRRIVVITRCDPSLFSLLRQVGGIILQNIPQDADSEKYALELAKRYNIPMIYRAEAALKFLKDDRSVTLDPEKGIVCNGSKKAVKNG